MLNHEGSHPEYFEELCALAASGQLSEAESVELQDHMQQCAHCRSIHADFTDLLHNKLPLVDPDLRVSSKLAGLFSEDCSYRERFLTRARKQGLAIRPGPLRNGLRSKWRIWLLPGLGYTEVATLTIALLVVAIGVLGYSLRQKNVRYRTLAADLVAMSRQISNADRPERNPAPETRSEVPSPVVTPTPPIATPSKTDAELVRARQSYAAAEARAKVLEEQLGTAMAELKTLSSRQEEASNLGSQLKARLADAEAAAARVNDELQKLRQGRSDDTAKIAAQAVEIRELSEELTARTEMLERERMLLTAGRDIHELMGARNLHIVDVLDVNSKGKDHRAFGRVFYTEGKSLIFYAFELGNRATERRNASFQAWGSRGLAQNPVRSLGIFYVDDQKQNRWVLKFDDPRVLAEIDSVFVTVEPQGGSIRPTGNRFLYAYLKANPNHP